MRLSYKLWLIFLAHIMVFIMLLAKMGGVAGQESVFAEQFWLQVQSAFLSTFANSAAQLLLLFLLLSPLWAIFITRGMCWYGKIVYFLALMWIVVCILFYYNYISLQVWMMWFLYASMMLVLGLLGIIYRVFCGQEEINTSNRD